MYLFTLLSLYFSKKEGAGVDGRKSQVGLGRGMPSLRNMLRSPRKVVRLRRMTTVKIVKVMSLLMATMETRSMRRPAIGLRICIMRMAEWMPRLRTMRRMCIMRRLAGRHPIPGSL
jgi:hypothetical protein